MSAELIPRTTCSHTALHLRSTEYALGIFNCSVTVAVSSSRQLLILNLRALNHWRPGKEATLLLWTVATHELIIVLVAKHGNHRPLRESAYFSSALTTILQSKVQGNWVWEGGGGAYSSFHTGYKLLSSPDLEYDAIKCFHKRNTIRP